MFFGGCEGALQFTDLVTSFLASLYQVKGGESQTSRIFLFQGAGLGGLGPLC